MKTKIHVSVKIYPEQIVELDHSNFRATPAVGPPGRISGVFLGLLGGTGEKNRPGGTPIPSRVAPNRRFLPSIGRKIIIESDFNSKCIICIK